MKDKLSKKTNENRCKILHQTMINNEEIADAEGLFNMIVMPSIAYLYNNNEFGESVCDNKKNELQKKFIKVNTGKKIRNRK